MEKILEELVIRLKATNQFIRKLEHCIEYETGEALDTFIDIRNEQVEIREQLQIAINAVMIINEIGE